MQLVDGAGVRAVHDVPAAEYIRYGMLNPLLSRPQATKPPLTPAATESQLGPLSLAAVTGSVVRAVHVEAGAVELAARPSNEVLKSDPTAT